MVEDTGVGMTNQQVSRLFQPFTKIMVNRSLNKEGVGLGLAVSRNIARALGGDISVKSQIELGSIFTLHLPNLGEGASVSILVGTESAHDSNSINIEIAEANAECEFPH